MQGNKARKNMKKKSYRKANPSPCGCFFCEGNWLMRLITKTRCRRKYIKHYSQWIESQKDL